MTKNLAGRGEGLAGLAIGWRQVCDKIMAGKGAAKADAEDLSYADALRHCAADLEMAIAALEAAAPAGTADAVSSGIASDELAKEICEEVFAKELFASIPDSCWEVAKRFDFDSDERIWRLAKLLAALATPSPQAPAPAVDSQSDILRIARAIYLQTKNWRFGISYPQSVDATSWAAEAVRRGLGVEWATDWIHQGYPEVPQWIIGTNQSVVPAATQEQPAGSIPKIPDAPDTRHAIYRSAEFERGVMSRLEWTDALHATYFALFGKQAPESMKACDISHAIVDFKLAGSPRKVGEDAIAARLDEARWWRAQLFSRSMGDYYKATATQINIEDRRISDLEEQLTRLRPSSVPVGEQKQEQGV